MQRLLVDSGFVFALFDARDQHHADANKKQEWLEILSIAIPWPILYETINTRHARRPDWIARFENIVRSRDTEFIDDAPYRLDAFDEVMLRGKTQRHAIVHAHDRQGNHAVLEIQAKLSVTFAPSDREFCEVVGHVARASQNPRVPVGRHKLAVAISRSSRKIDGPYQQVLTWARRLESHETFFAASVERDRPMLTCAPL